MTELDDVVSRLSFTRRIELGPSTDRSLRRAVPAGELERLRRGVFRPRAEDSKRDILSGRERAERERQHYLDQAVAVMMTRHRMPVLSHYAALAAWNLPVVRPWPRVVDLLVGPTSNLRSKNGVRVHRDEYGREDVVEYGGFVLTTPARTIVDLARDGDFEAAVVALDYALSGRASSDQLVTKDDVWACLDAMRSSRGRALATKAVEFGNGKSGSPGESVSRIGIHVLGFPAPELQVRHPAPNGGHYETDFEWLEYRQIGEFDGLGKYLKRELAATSDPGKVVHEEKIREDNLRGEGNGVARWGWPEALHLPTLRELLLKAGLPIVRRPVDAPHR
jgi:hypothetical protein